MLIFQPGGTQTLTEFDVKWRNWHEEVDRCLQDNSFASNQHLELICKVSDPEPSAALAVSEMISVVYCIKQWEVLFKTSDVIMFCCCVSSP